MKAKWTFMVYIAGGDNDFDDPAERKDIEERAKVGSSGHLKTIAQLD